MRKISVVLIPAVMWLAGSLPVTAQETKQAVPLSLTQCLEIAQKNQVDIKVAQNNVTAARSQSTRAKSAYYPQVSIQNNAFSIGSKGVLTQRNTGTAAVTTINIYDGGQREARVSGTKYNLAGSQAGLQRTAQTVTFAVTRSYYDVLRAKHLADVAQADIKYNETLKQSVEAKIDVGDAAQVDVLPVDAQLANAKVNLIAAQRSVRASLVQLQNDMGLSPQNDFDIQDVSEQPNPEIRPLDTYITTAIASRPDVGEAQAGVGAANASVKSSKIALYPIPKIAAEYQQGISGVSGSSGQIFGGVSFDVFNGGSNRAAYKEALAIKDTAQQRSQQVIKDIQAEVQQAYLNLNDAKERMAASEASFASSEQNYNVQQEKYKQGLAITLDLLNAELQLVTAQTNLVQARYDFYTAIAQMDFAVGKDGGFNAG